MVKFWGGKQRAGRKEGTAGEDEGGQRMSRRAKVNRATDGTGPDDERTGRLEEEKTVSLILVL